MTDDYRPDRPSRRRRPMIIRDTSGHPTNNLSTATEALSFVFNLAMNDARPRRIAGASGHWEAYTNRDSEHDDVGTTHTCDFSGYSITLQ